MQHQGVLKTPAAPVRPGQPSSGGPQYSWELYHYDNLRIDRYEVDLNVTGEYWHKRWRPMDGGMPKVLADKPVHLDEITETPDSFRLHYPSGAEVEYTKIGGGWYDLECQSWDTQTYVPTTITSRTGATLTLTYNLHTKGGRCQSQFYTQYHRLHRVTDELGGFFEFSYGGPIGEGGLETITDHTGRVVQLTHDENGDLTEILLPVVTPIGDPPPPDEEETPTRFTYDDVIPGDDESGHNIETITAPNETAEVGGAPYVTNVWSEDKVVRQTYGGTNASGVPAGGIYDFVYEDEEIDHGSFVEHRRTLVVDPVGNVRLSIFDQWGRARVEYRFFGRHDHPAEPISQDIDQLVQVDPADPSSGGSLIGGHAPLGSSDAGETVQVIQKEYSAHGMLIREEGPDYLHEWIYDEQSPDRHQRFNLLVHRKSDIDIPGRVVEELYGYEPLFQQIRAAFDSRGSAQYQPQNGSSPLDPWERYGTRAIYDYQEGDAQAVANLVEDWEIDLVQQSAQDTLAAIGPTLGQISFDLGDAAGNGDGQVDQPLGHPVRSTSWTSLFDDAHAVGPASFHQEELVTLRAYNALGLEAWTLHPGGDREEVRYYPTSDPAGLGGASGEVDGGGFPAEAVVAAGTPEEEIVRSYWNAVGDLVTTETSDGQRLEAIFDERRRIVESRDQFGTLTRFEYDQNGNVIRTLQENCAAGIAVDAPADVPLPQLEPTETEFVFDILDHLVEKRMHCGQEVATLRYRYDRAETRILTLYPRWDSDPHELRATLFDELGRPMMEMSGGVTLQFSRLAGNAEIPELLLLPVDGPDQANTQKKYTGTRMVRTIDGDEHSRIHRHDGLGWTFEIEDPLGNIERFAHDILGQVLSVSQIDADEQLLTSTWSAYDEQGRVFEAGSVVLDDPSILVDGPLTPDDGLVTTRTVYDLRGHVILQVFDDLTWVETEYDGARRTTLTTDSAGNESESTYDGRGNLIRVVNRDRSTKTGAVAVRTTWFFHDEGGRVVAQASEEGGSALVQRQVVDSFGRVILSTDARGSISASETLLDLDLLGQHSNLAALPINEHGNAATYHYDSGGSLTKAQRYMREGGTGAGAIDTDVAGDGIITTQISYDLNGRATSQTDDRGNTTLYEYDPLGRVTRVQFADGTDRIFTYTRRGKVDTARDANGTLIDWVYDAANRPSVATLTLGSGVLGPDKIEFDHDGFGRLTGARTFSAQVLDSDVSRAYDSLSHLIWESIDGRATTARFDSMDRLVSIESPSGEGFTYDYSDAAGRLSALIDSETSQELAAYDYSGVSSVEERRHPGGVVWTASFDDLGRVIGTNASGPGGPLIDQTYLLNAAGSKSSRTDTVTGAVRTFEHDSAERMVSRLITGGGGPTEQVVYSLDGTGNRTNVIGGPDEGTYTMTGSDTLVNAYTEVPAGTQTHDANGNLTSRVRVVNDVTELHETYAYDAFNRLVLWTDLLTGESVELRYDALGRRVEKRTGPTATDQVLYSYAPYRGVCEEVDGLGQVLDVYAYGNNPHTPLVHRRFPAGIGPIVTAILLADDMGNIIATVHEQGTLIESFEYDDFGRVLDPVTRAAVDTSLLDSKYFWAGKRLDAESGLYDSVTRHIDPSTGRFLQRDPLGIWADPLHVGNGYGYANNNPWSLVDVSGFLTVPPPGDSSSGSGDDSEGGSSSEAPDADKKNVRGDCSHHGSVSGKKGKSGKRISDREYRRRKAKFEEDLVNLWEGTLVQVELGRLTREDLYEILDTVLSKAVNGCLECAIEAGHAKYNELLLPALRRECAASEREASLWAAISKGAAFIAGATDSLTMGMSGWFNDDYDEAMERIENDPLTKKAREYGEKAEMVAGVAKGLGKLAVKAGDDILGAGANSIRKSGDDLGKAAKGGDFVLPSLNKADARALARGMGLPSAQARAVSSAIGRATSTSGVRVTQNGPDVIVEVFRKGDDGFQVMESTVRLDGTKSVIQKAFDSAGNLVHVHVK